MTSSKPERHCLITVGATVGFQTLTSVALTPTFWNALHERGFTSLRLQCGPDEAWAGEQLSRRSKYLPPGFHIEVFDMRKNLMKEEMVLCKASEGRKQGLIISHAGTGSILDAWKIGVPLVVVPNDALLDNHQTEMAAHVAREGYAIASTADMVDLEEAIDKSERLAEKNQSRWPANSITPSGDSTSLWTLGPEEVTKEQNAQMAHD